MLFSKSVLIRLLYLYAFTLLVFVVFLNAREGFSYDYNYYLSYIIEIADTPVSALFNNVIGIYVPLNSSAGVEIGFVLLVKLITQILDNEVVIYAVMACFSIFIKGRVLLLFNVKSIWLYLILIYSCILLEGNALRSGIALSFFLLALSYYLRKQTIKMLFLFICSTIVHIQAFYFIFLFFIFLLLKRTNLMNKKWFVSVLVLIALSLGPLMSIIFEVFSAGKLELYALNKSQSGGVNVVTVLSLIIMFIVFTLIIKNTGKIKFDLDNRLLLMGLALISLSTLSLYAFFTSVAVIGDRLWQWGLILFCAAYFSLHPNKSFTPSKLLLLICLVFYIINITFRYPLTNLLYPLVPYMDFSKL